MQEELINKIKEQVAIKHGYRDDILGNSWEYAMYLLHRKKAQLELYDEVILELANKIISLKNDVKITKNVKPYENLESILGEDLGGKIYCILNKIENI